MSTRPSQARSKAAAAPACEPDVFNLNPGGSVSGGIAGMSGNSIINYYTAANVTNVTISGFAHATSYGYSGDSHSIWHWP